LQVGQPCSQNIYGIHKISHLNWPLDPRHVGIAQCRYIPDQDILSERRRNPFFAFELFFEILKIIQHEVDIVRWDYTKKLVNLSLL
jgi:hypothetical protein